jgi:hypothetical protein
VEGDGNSRWARRYRDLNATAKDEFPVLSDFLAAGMTDYVAIINRFAPQGVIGEMDGLYSSWATRVPDGFSDGQVAALQRRVALRRRLFCPVATTMISSSRCVSRNFAMSFSDAPSIDLRLKKRRYA